MRRLFLIGAKLLGLLQLFWLVAGSFQLLVGLSAVTRMEGTTQAQTILTIFGGILFLVVSGFLALILLFKTERLAELLHLPSDSDDTRLDQAHLLYVGAKLIGLFVFVRGLSSFVQALFQLRHLAPYSGFMWSTIAPGFVHVVLGLVLLLKTKRVVELITRDAGNTE